MPLFVVQHKHDAETCPASNPEMGPMLLKHVAAPNAEQFGVTVQSEAVLDGQHTFYLTLEAADVSKVEQFMAPFAQVGSVDVWPASSCERVVERGNC